MAAIHTGTLNKVIVLGDKEWQATLKKYRSHDLPTAIARAFEEVARTGIVVGQRSLDRGLTLRSNWVTRGVKGMPTKPTQRKAFIRAFTTYGDAQGSVFIRGAARPQNQLDFLLDHERGTDRTAHSGMMAVPLPGIKEMGGGDYRTSTGRTKTRFKPKRLLKRYNAKSRKKKQKMKSGKSFIVQVQKENGKYGQPFIFTSKGGKGRRPQERRKWRFLYLMKKTTNQTKKISFERHIVAHVNTNLRRTAIKHISRIKI